MLGPQYRFPDDRRQHATEEWADPEDPVMEAKTGGKQLWSLIRLIFLEFSL